MLSTVVTSPTTIPQLVSSKHHHHVDKTLQETPGFRMRKFNKNKRFKQNYFEMRMMDASATCSSFETTSFNQRNNCPQNKKRTSCQLSSSAKRKKSQPNIETINHGSSIGSSNSNSNSIPFVMNDNIERISNSINDSLPIISFNDDELSMVNIPSFSIHQNFESFPNYSNNSITINNNNSLVDLLMSNNDHSPTITPLNNNNNNGKVIIEQVELLSSLIDKESNSIIEMELLPTRSSSSHIPHTTSLKELKNILNGGTLCNNSIASPLLSVGGGDKAATSSSINVSTHSQQLLNNNCLTLPPSLWSNILPLKPVCIDEIYSEWEGLMVEKTILVNGSGGGGDCCTDYCGASIGNHLVTPHINEQYKCENSM